MDITNKMINPINPTSGEIQLPPSSSINLPWSCEAAKRMDGIKLERIRLDNLIPIIIKRRILSSSFEI